MRAHTPCLPTYRGGGCTPLQDEHSTLPQTTCLLAYLHTLHAPTAHHCLPSAQHCLPSMPVRRPAPGPSGLWVQTARCCLYGTKSTDPCDIFGDPWVGTQAVYSKSKSTTKQKPAGCMGLHCLTEASRQRRALMPAPAYCLDAYSQRVLIHVLVTHRARPMPCCQSDSQTDKPTGQGHV